MTERYANKKTVPVKKLTTSTVPKKKAGIDDPLKPTGEMHILIGGPYKDAAGEEHRYGHTALRIKTKSSDLTYDFGRYGKVSGSFGESGEGILRVWNSFLPYIKGEIALLRKTTGFVYAIFDHQGELVNDYFRGLVKRGNKIEGKNTEVKNVYKLATDYHALGLNCTTLSLDGAKKALTNIDQGSDAYNKPEEVLSFTERLALKAKGGATRLFLPANLLTFLSDGCLVKPIRVDVYGSGK